jgi:hypothetical protein
MQCFPGVDHLTKIVQGFPGEDKALCILQIGVLFSPVKPRQKMGLNKYLLNISIINGSKSDAQHNKFII